MMALFGCCGGNIDSARLSVDGGRDTNPMPVVRFKNSEGVGFTKNAKTTTRRESDSTLDDCDLEIEQALPLPWKKMCSESLRSYIPVQWGLEEYIKDILREESQHLKEYGLRNLSTFFSQTNLVHLQLVEHGKYLGEVQAERNSSMKLDGFGHLHIPGKEYYLGQHEKGFKHGVGLLIYPNGNYFIGILEYEHLREGKYFYNNGQKYYVGKFKNGLPEGQGTLTFLDGREYKGNFSKGNRSGRGTFNWPNGNFYEGDWKDDKQHGIGNLRVENIQKTLVTVWKNGVLEA